VGSGKSTLIEAIAEACALPIWGGSRNETANRHGPDQRAASAAHCALRSVGVRATAISSAPNCSRTSRRCSMRAETTRTSRAIPTRATAADR